MPKPKLTEGFRWTYAVNATAQERKVDLGAGAVKIGPWELLVRKTPRGSSG